MVRTFAVSCGGSRSDRDHSGCAGAIEGLISAPYLAGESYSLAGIRVVPHFDRFHQTLEGEAILAGKSKLAEWFQPVSERPGAKKVLQPV